MRQEDFAAAVRDRGCDVDVWLVYAEDRRESILGSGFQLHLRGAFWKRGEAYAFAARSHVESQWQHCYVFRLRADALWAAGTAPRRVEFETVFNDGRDLPVVAVTPAEVAGALVQETAG